MRRFRLSVAAALAASLVLAGCGGGDDEEPDDGGDPKSTGKETVLSSTWPLTGLDVTDNQSAARKHPVFVVKIDNTANSAPQVGLGSADLVVEQLVEGGESRLAAFFYSELPDNVGPVRSMRATDIGIVKPVGGQLVTSGAAGETIGRLQNAGVRFHGEGAPGLYRDSARPSLYSVMARLRDLADSVSGKAERPEDYLPWGEADDLPRGQKARALTADFGRHTTEWEFRNGTYVNTNSFAAEGDRFPADTVLVLRVQVVDAGYRDPAGNFVPESKLVGRGQAMVFHGGRLVRGTWEKAEQGSALVLSTKAGKLTVPAGRTWIELVPTGSGDVSFR